MNSKFIPMVDKMMYLTESRSETAASLSSLMSHRQMSGVAI